MQDSPDTISNTVHRRHARRGTPVPAGVPEDIFVDSNKLSNNMFIPKIVCPTGPKCLDLKNLDKTIFVRPREGPRV